MKRMMLLFAAMMISWCVFADTEIVDGIEWTYEIYDGEASVDGANPATGAIAIPSTLDVYPVTSIGEYAFDGCSEMTSVTIPSSVINIGDCAFSCCDGLTNITIPSSVTSIGEWAFYGCSGLTSVEIPSSVTNVGGWAFCQCFGLTSVTIPSSVTSIGESAFECCSGLTSVTIPSSMTNIGDCAFYGCSGLTSVTIPEGVTNIGDYAFQCCSALMSVTIPNGVTSIGDCAFEGCSGLTSVTIPSSVTSIGWRAFYECSGIRDVTVPGWQCGMDFSSVTNLVISDETTEIEEWAFAGCCGLTSVTIPSSVTSIGEGAFEDCSGLTSVTIPSSVINIGGWAFEGCSGLTGVEIPNGVTSIGDCAFGDCSGLTSVTIPEGVTSIGEYAFAYCAGLERIRIPANVSYLGEGVFCGCENLHKVYFEGDAPALGDTNIYEDTSWCSKLVTYVARGSVGWSSEGSSELPDEWCGHPIQYYKTCKVYFNANGGVCPQTVREIPKSDWIGELPTAEREGYLFLGWYTAASDGHRITSTSTPSADVIYYAHWFKENTTGAWSGDAVPLTMGSTVKKSSVSLVPEYDSNRGTFDAGEGVYYYTFTLKRGEGCQYYLTADSSGSVYYDDDFYPMIGIECLTADAPSPDDDYSGDYSGVISPSDWDGHSAASATYVVRISGDVDRAIGFNYKTFNGYVTLFLDCNGGRIYWEDDGVGFAETVIECDATVPSSYLSYCKPYRYGYTFEGWYTASSGGKKITEKTIVTGPTTFYAHWKKTSDTSAWFSALTLGTSWKESSHTLYPSYDAECDCYDFSEGVYYYAITVPRGSGCMLYLTSSGTSYYDDDADGPYIDYIESAGDIDAPSFDNEDYYATLDPEEWSGYSAAKMMYYVRVYGSVGREFTLHYKLYNGSCELYLDCQGGEVTYVVEGDSESEEYLELGVERGVAIGQSFLDFYVPKREKYTFDGWYTAPVGGTKITAKSVVSSDATWYAHWSFGGSAYVGVAVSDECDGMGTVTGGNKSFKAGAKVSLKATTKKGYVFAGWYDASGEPLAGTVDYRTPNYTYIATGEEDTTIYAKFIAAEDDWATVDCAAEEEYAKGETMTPIEIAVDSGSLATVKVTGLPTGMKFTAKALSVKATKTTDAAEYAANTIYGTPTKSGVYTATVTATTAGKATATQTLKFIVRGEGESIVDANVVLVDADGYTVEDEAVPGKVTGMGVYAANKKVTLKATANKGYVFMGWHEDGDLVSRLASHAFTMPDYDVALEARFITAETDRAAIAASVGDEFWFDAERATAEKTISAGVYLEWPVAAEALSATTIKVTGLPTGLKFTAKDIVDSKTKEILIPANTIYGTPSAASKKVKAKGEGEQWTVTPSQVKITVTTAGKNAQTFQIDTTVVALPEQVVGTFTGGSCDDPSGSATLTVAASGKVSGKWISDGKTWTLAATGFTSGEPDGYQFDTTLTAKYGKETQEIPLTVTSDGVAMCDLFSAYWANWKIDPWKTLGKAMANKKYTFYIDSDGNTSEDVIDSPYGTVTLTMSANGTVKTAGSFVTGTNAKTGKDIVYKASGSTVLTPIDETTYRVFVYFPPKGTFVGYARSLTLSWDGSAFSEQWGGAVACKPVVYLYPEEETSCRVTLELDGKLTCTYPDYGANGWTNFIASPDGTLTFPDGQSYYCLFWEGATHAEWDFSQGYCVKGSDTAAFLADILLQMGLSFREANEFIIYWLPLMQDNPYNVIAFQGENYANAARLTVDPKPDSVLRVFMAWKSSDRAVDIPAPVVTPFERSGFTVVEWGGTQIR